MDSVQVIKDCPFCGKPGVVGVWEDWPDCQSKPDCYWSVGCDNEFCHGSNDNDQFYGSRISAIKNWNKRDKQ